jgi:hypothetical protein
MTIAAVHSIIRDVGYTPTKRTFRQGIAYGDNLHAATPATLAAAFDDAVAVNAAWVRHDLAWDDVQPTSSTQFLWGYFDAIVAAANDRHLKVLPILAYTPSWAGRVPPGTSDKYPPTDPNLFATFAAQAVARYAPHGVHTWEIWNEPNVGGFWAPSADPTGYKNLVSAAVTAMKAVDPTAFIITGGTAPTSTSGPNYSPIDWTNQLCSNGTFDLVDGVGVHPYSYPVPPGYVADWNAWWQMEHTSGTSLQSIVSTLTNAGYNGTTKPLKKLWCTEYGAPTGGPGNVGTIPTYGLGTSPDHVDEPLQAQMANDSVTQAAASANIDALFWYSYKDLGTSMSTIQNWFGQRRFDGTAKPAWQNYHDAVKAHL